MEILIIECVVGLSLTYILSLKGNQSNLHEEVRTLFEEQKEENYRDIDPDKIQQKTTLEKGRGRIEKRTYCIIEDIDWMQEKEKYHL